MRMCKQRAHACGQDAALANTPCQPARRVGQHIPAQRARTGELGAGTGPACEQMLVGSLGEKREQEGRRDGVGGGTGLLRNHLNDLQVKSYPPAGLPSTTSNAAGQLGLAPETVLAELLDAQEQRIYQLQTKQRERQAELEQKCRRIQQLSQDLGASCQLQEKAQKQAVPCLREPAAQLRAELSGWQWRQQATLEQALQHMHAATCTQEKLQRSQEQLQALREQLGAEQEQSQGLRHSVARLEQELGATWAREQQRLQQLSGATETIHDLQQEAASTRKRLAELLQEAQDTATLQAELAQAQQEKAKQEAKAVAYKEERQQLLWELRELQGCQERSKQEAQALQEQLQELSSRAQHWQQLHWASQQALATREEELVVCKLELLFLKEELSKATEQIETLRSSQALARHKSSRTHKERELVLVNISQHLAERMQLHERQGQEIQQQSEQSVELTGSRAELSARCCCLQGCRGQTDNHQPARAPASPHPPSLPTRHLQGAGGRGQEENMYLVVRTCEHKRERL
ncbi:polyamine-modulated factor 1-binding protein 1 [Athene cunicularia]|uniref:polyamine-modulated factor 1-binding protein 1 n=1 Tax=Athene cunicularia TaxID=194338 RepID=UPI000EF7116F|nr:polyamine-modulated factor 1-binding protein 1 [Athene cunicularia]